MIGKNDYKEMEVKLNGNWQKADVLKTLTDGTCLILMGNKISNGNYMSGACVPAEAYREIKRTKTILKPLPELIQTLLDLGYEPDSDGDWYHEELDCFFASDFSKCGKETDVSGYGETEWTKEVPLDEPDEADEDEDEEFMFI